MHSHRSDSGDPFRPRRLFAFILVLFVLMFALAGCSSSASGSVNSSPEDREAAFRQIATNYATSGDLNAALAALDKLKLANPGQLIISLAEADMNAGRSQAEILPLVNLAGALGVRSTRLVAYLAPSPEPIAPTAVPPTQTAAPRPTATSAPPTVTVEPPTATIAPTAVPPSATPPPQKPRVVAESSVNLRSGPGRAYPVIGQLNGGQEVDIIGRNASGDWWRLAWSGNAQAWVAGTVVRVLGAIDTVAEVEDIPAPPTAAPRPTAAPVVVRPTAPPTSAFQYVVQSVRLRSVGEDAQSCTGGDHNIFVVIVDAGGAPVDGVRVREIWTGIIQVTGAQGKGAGRVEYDLYKGGGGQVEIVDEANNRIGELSRGMNNDWPPFDLMKAAGYCNCKPHPDDSSCESDLNNRQYLFAMDHYAYEVVFRRTW